MGKRDVVHKTRSIEFIAMSFEDRATATGNTYRKLEMWADAKRDGRPAKYRWRPLFNAAKFG